MVGDFIIWARVFIIQNLICLHNYKYVVNRSYNWSDFKECIKCKKIKK